MNTYNPTARSCRKITAAIMMAGLFIFSSSCKSDYPVSARQGQPGDAGAPREVKVARVTEMPMERAIVAMGALAAFDEATISVKVPGRVRSITVDLGSVVRKGQLIAQLEPKDYELRLEQAEAALSQARARLGLSPEGGDMKVDPEQTGTVRQARAMLEETQAKRDRLAKLLQQGVIARGEYDTAEAEYKVAQSRLQDATEEIRNRQGLMFQRISEVEIARKQLTDTNVYAAFEGTVQEKQISMGEYLAAGAPVVTIVRMNPLRLRAEVPERDAGRVRTGQQVRVTVEGDPNVYPGRIARISPTIGTENRTLIVEAEVTNNGHLKPGAFARANIVTDPNALTTAVPATAVISFAGVDKVIIVQDGKAVEKPITVGRRSGDWVELLSGVNVGDQVVLSPGNLQSGQAVQITE